MHAFAFLLALGLALQDDPSAQASTLVHVHVTALDARGRAVDDLEPGDFRVIEGDAERPVESVRRVRAEGSLAQNESVPPILSVTDERAEAARDGTRMFALFLDDYHVAPGPASGIVREALLEFVNVHLGPRDLVVVLKPLDSLLRIRLTRDFDAVRTEIAAFEGRKGRLEPRNAFEQEFIAASPARTEAVRAQISMSVLTAIVTHLGQLPGGRKTLVVASEGFERPPRRRGDSLPTMPGLIRMAQREGVVVHVLDPRDEPPPAQVEGDGAGEPSPALPGREMLRELADGTDGVAIFGPNAWRDGFTQVAATLGSYYVVGFRSGAPGDGRFHEIGVQTTRPAVTVRAPRGYWTDSPLERLRATMAVGGRVAPPPALPVRRTSPLIRPWFGVARAADGFARVSFVWEAVDQRPSARRRTSDPARVTMRVMTPDGIPVFEGVVTPVTLGSPTTSLAIFDAPEGRLRIELAIEDDAAGRIDTDVRDVVVDAPDPSLSLGTAAVFRGRTAREMRATRDNPNAVPTATRTFSRTEQLLIRVPVYAVGGRPAVSATLVSRAGRAMRALAVGPGPAADQQQVELPLAGLVAGEYRLEVTAVHDGRAVSQPLDFRVVP